MAKKQERDKARILEYLSQKPVKELAAKKVGVSHATLYRWLKEDHEFAEAVDETLDEGRGVMSDFAESQLFKAIQNGDLNAIRYYLNNNNPRYGAYAQHTHSDKQPNEFKNVAVVPFPRKGYQNKDKN